VNVSVPLRHRGIRVAYVFAGSTGAWMAHLIFASSFVRYSCNAGGVDWAQHLFTALMALVCIHAAWVAYGLHREGRADPEDAGTSMGANNFIGVAGILVCLTNLLLILSEGSFVALIHQACRP
jgi:hypothetical protein